MTFKHLHSSSRFNRSAKSLETALDRYMLLASIITITEVADADRAEKLYENGWGVAQAQPGGKAADCAILYRKQDWELLIFKAIELGDATYRNKRGFQTRPIRAAFAILKHNESDKKLLVTVAHLPSGVQGGSRLNKTDQARAFLANVREWKRFINWYERTYETDATLVSADWNLDIKKIWVRAFLKANFPNFKINWSKPFPERGTFNNRIIDIALLKGLKVKGKPKILHHDNSSDHTPYWERLSFK